MLSGFRRTRHDELWALDGVSFEVPEGTTFGLIGENGSGKSTLLKCMARILRPERGSISIPGSVSALLELGAGFHPELSGRDNVYLNGSILGLSRRQLDAAFDEIVSFAGLERFIDTPVKNYSSGMYVRLGFSVAINVDPDVLLVDEVLAVGDEQFQQRCNEKFAELKREGRTVVVVSHALETVRAICDGAAWLEHGQLRSVGPAGEVTEAYLRYVREARRVAEAASGEGPPPAVGEPGSVPDVTIDAVEVLDRGLQPTRDLPSGDPATVRLHYSVVRPVGELVVVLMLRRNDGLLLGRVDTRGTEGLVRTDAGAGVLDLRLARVPLVPGSYFVSLAVQDANLLHTATELHQAAEFEVVPGHATERVGLLALDASWHVPARGPGAEEGAP